VPERAELQRRTTELLQRLIRFDTVNPPGNEGPAQEWLRGLLEAAGFECELLAAVAGRPNLIARLRSGSDGPALCLLGHVDTVLADPAEWSVDPWSGELRDGCVWGRGAIDMKSQVAAELVAVLVLVEEGWRPEAGELMLVFTADEETGAVQGAQWLCREHPDRVRADLVVNEGAGAVLGFGGRRVYPVCVAEKGVFRFKLTTEGRAGHASVPRIGDNAIAKLAPVLTALGERRPSLDPTPELEALLRALGLKRKLKLGRWFVPALRGLRAMRRLRATPLDPFGLARVRRVERQLVGEYEELVATALTRLGPGNHATAVELCELPDMVRGYEDIKLRTVERFRERASELSAELA